MKKWEYKTVIADKVEHDLNQYGSEGWELVSSHIYLWRSNLPEFVFIFKRIVL